MRNNNIPIYSKNDFENMRLAGSLAAHVLDSLYEIIVPGITTQEINDICHKIIIKNNAIPAPQIIKVSKSVDTSVNHVVCHRSFSKKLSDGDNKCRCSYSKWLVIVQECLLQEKQIKKIIIF